MKKIKHKWTFAGKKWNFCVKCGMTKESFRRNPLGCNKTEEVFEKRHPHQFYKDKNGNARCKKCGIRYTNVVVFYTVNYSHLQGRDGKCINCGKYPDFSPIPLEKPKNKKCAKAFCFIYEKPWYSWDRWKPYVIENGKRRYFPSITIPCINSHDEFIVRDIIE